MLQIPLQVRISLPLFFLPLLLLGCQQVTRPEASPSIHPEVQGHQLNCEAGHPESCASLGHIYKNELHGVPRDLWRASELYRMGCDGGVGWACTNLGVNYERGQGIKKDEPKAVALYQRGCDLGSHTSCTNLGSLLASGTGVERDEKRARELYTQACAAGNGRACSLLAIANRDGRGGPQDDAQALHFAQRGCELGSGPACTNTGWFYEQGRGADKDDERATDFYRLACQADAPIGCSNLGLNLENGRGTAPDPAQAAHYYQKACAGGFRRACYSLARLYRDGRGVTQETDRAIDLFEHACPDHPRACSDLGTLYRDGELLSKDLDRAKELFITACQKGDSTGCSNIAEFPEIPGWSELLSENCLRDKNTCLSAARAHLRRDQPGDALKTRELLETGCDGGHFMSCLYQPALRHVQFQAEYERGCADGDGVACLNLSSVMGGEDHDSYDVLCTQPERALPDQDAVDAACSRGEAEACWLRGVRQLPPREPTMMLVGIATGRSPGAAPDKEKEAHLRTSCKEEDAQACADLAEYLREHDDDHDEPLRFDEQACALQSWRGCRSLAFALLDAPESTPDDHRRAITLLDRACQEEDAPACTRRADLLLQEDSPDHQRIFSLYQSACQSGFQRACSKLRSYFKDRGDDLHNRACYFHYVFETCTFNDWSGCHTIRDR